MLISDLDEVSEDSEIELPKDITSRNGDVLENSRDLDPSSIQLPPEPAPTANYSIPPQIPSYPVSMNQFYSTNPPSYGPQMMPFGVYTPTPQFPMFPQCQPPPPWEFTAPPPFQQVNYGQVPSYYEEQFSDAPPPPPEEAPMSPNSELRASTDKIVE